MVGLGGVAQEHMRGIAASDRLVLAAGADINSDRASKSAADYGLKPYSDVTSMIANEALDGILVLTPPQFHLPVIKVAMNAGLPVLCEKPLAASRSDAEAIRNIVLQTGRAFQFGASYRFLPAIREAREIVQSGALGVIRCCSESLIGGQGAEAVESLSPVHYPEGGPGGTPMGLVDHGVHLIDAISWITGLAPTSVFGRGNISGDHPLAESVLMTLERGALVSLSYDEGTFGLSLPGSGVFTEGAGWNVDGFVSAGSYDAYPCILTIHGSDGALRIYPYANRLYHADADGLRQVPVDPLPNPNHFRLQAEEFGRAIRGEAQPGWAAGLDDGLAALDAVLGVYESQKSGRVVTLNYPD
ncbi:hypothetical protein GCM10007854_22540 [Algimonas porphyrae]|uniref:Gfo/Idh/MocA family oxidoreductase n=1 Tax=Algimonas porphyrae TaxID=1128113 RepID=A0ABQ5V3J2_9PROT|nr:hypothetical protein GCM10007854_22540 [Algimonas porphyrae]